MRWDSRQLEALAAVLTEGSFEAAARDLHVTPSAVSQRVRALESAAGTVLVRRTRPVGPTAPGRTLLRLARQVALLDAEAALEIGGGLDRAPGDADGPGGVPVSVPLAVNADSLATWLMPALGRLDGVCVDLHVADQDRTVDLLPAGTVMVAVTSQAEPVQGCTSRALGVMRYRAAATRAFVERWFPEGPTPAALERAPMVVFDRSDGLQDAWLRGRSGTAGHPVPAPPRHHVPSTSDFLEAIRIGLGWGMWGPIARPGAAFPLVDERADGIVPLDDATVDVPLYLQQWKLRSATLDRVCGALVDEARRALPPA
ncbi:LysR family transcriptional regulator ArgP [Isoptericola sp. NEAU-Y5]|uniref:LysR family transcriptional regulator ArgP n=1 Tax=Isoptericola luteus TaxID=2879484 RepID=A0ABS7ZGI8_9MICO|nr:LysR family transcriptional regulator ArgP [Isoptericola sp. NEAU-Y5]MCA5893421.1 LysR family transcriptional regulator ArgP [Isoptericola sp. NEAU-Y5]